jgi:hypothetical protein
MLLPRRFRTTALFPAFVGNIFHFMIHAAPRHRRICCYSSGRVAPFGSCSGTRIAFWWLSASHPSLFASTMKLCLSFLMAMRYFFGRWRRTFSRSGLFPRDQLPFRRANYRSSAAMESANFSRLAWSKLTTFQNGPVWSKMARARIIDVAAN